MKKKDTDVKDWYVDMSGYECFPCRKLHVGLIVPEDGTLRKHVNNVNRILLREYGDDFAVIG